MIILQKYFLTNSIVIGMMVLLAHPVFSYDVNKDLINIGNAKAYDVAVELSGNTSITEHFDDMFGSFSSGPIGPNTLLHWQNFHDDDNNAIDPGQLIHIGWSTSSYSGTFPTGLGLIKDMYWTGADGQKLPGSKICNTINGWTYEQASGRIIIRWKNAFQKDCSIIHISRPVFTFLPNPIPLAELNRGNSVLNERFSPLFPASSNTDDRSPPFAILSNHDAMAYVNVPEGIPLSSRLVLRYNVTGEGSEAEAIDFVQSDPIETFPIAVPVSLGTFVNKDIKNIGNTKAYDVAVELSGSQVITGHYDGYPSGPKGGQFSSFSSGPIGPNTQLHWQNFYDGTNHVIDPGQTIHIGWGTQSNQAYIKDMYWTDAKGQKIPGSKLCNITSGWKYEQASRKIRVWWQNVFLNGCGIIKISHVMFAILPEFIPLAELNFENARLNQRLSLLPTPTGEPLSFEVSSNQEFATSIDLPQDMSSDSRLVLRYDVAGEESEVEATDFVETDPLKELSVELTGVMANVDEEGIHLNWTTGTETDNAGFRFWRATADGYGAYTNIITLEQTANGQGLTALPVANRLSDLIPALGRKDQGRTYAYVDTSTEQNATYYYLLEDVDMNGMRTFHCDHLMAATVGQGPAMNLEAAKGYCRMVTTH